MKEYSLSQNALNFYNEFVKMDEEEALNNILIMWNIRQMNRYNRIFTILKKEEFKQITENVKE